MKAEEYVKDLLLMEFLGVQSKNTKYSMRAYSRKVGIPQSAISEILGDKRRITPKMALKIMQGLGVAPDRIFDIHSAFTSQKSKLKIKSFSDQNFKAIDMDQFYLISDWYYFAILSLAETKHFKSDVRWIAQRLGITEVQSRTAVQRLLRLNMLTVDPKTKKIKSTGVQHRIDPGIATQALKKACRENLDLSMKALEETQFEERDFTAITLSFDPQKMTEAKRMIKNFRAKFAQQMDNGQTSEVYKLCIQLFPLTKKEVNS